MRDHLTDGLGPYPRSDDPPAPVPRSRAVVRGLLGVLGVLVVCGLAVGGFYGFLWAVNPVGDEWHCSDGEAPAGNGSGGGACYPEGSALPPGVTWEPFGNRPMSYNCDKDGWVPVERTVRRGGATDVARDCVREGTDLPGGWVVVGD